MTEEKWLATLSTTEPYNNIGLIKLRRNNENSEVMRVRLTKNSKPYDLTALKVFFVTHFSGKDGLNNPVQKEATIINAKEGIVEFIFDQDCMQKVGRQQAYFEIYDYDKFLDATQNFAYEIISSSRQVKADFGPWIGTWAAAEEMLDEGTAKVLNDKTEELELKKADVRDVDNKLSGKTDNTTFVALTDDLQRQIESTQVGILGEYYSEAELYKDYPVGGKGYAIVYLRVGTELVGYSYTYKNGAWTKGQVWNGTGIANGSIIDEKLATGSVTTRVLALYSVTIDRIAPNSVSESKILNGAITPQKASFMEIVSHNKVNPETRQVKKALNTSGNLADNASFFTTDYMITKNGDVWKSSQNIQSYSFYDTAKAHVSTVLNFGKNEFVSTVNGYIRVTYYSADGGQNTYNSMISNTGYLPPNFEPYQEVIKNKHVELLENITNCEVLPSGKNILDVSKATSNKRLDRFGNLVTVTTNFKASDLGFIKADTKYTASSVVEVIILDEYGKAIPTSFFTNNSDATWSFTTPKNARYFRATFGGEGQWSQIEEGDKYTGYEKVKYALFNQGRNLQDLTKEEEQLLPIFETDPQFPKNGQIWIKG